MSFAPLLLILALQDRPSPLPTLYISYGTLQILDVHSTLQGVSRGAQEANPLLRGLTRHTPALVALKAGLAANTLLWSEYLWKRGHRTAAVFVMVFANSLTAVAVLHNYQVSRALH
jgi:hypothetical protein